MATKPSRTTANRLSELDDEIVAAEAELLRRNELWKAAGAVVSVDLSRVGSGYHPARRIMKLKLAIGVDEGIVRLNRLKAEQAALLLRAVSDPGKTAALEAAAEAARRAHAEAEAAVRATRSAFAEATSALTSRHERAATLQRDITRYEAAITSAEAAAQREGEELRMLERYALTRVALAGTGG